MSKVKQWAMDVAEKAVDKIIKEVKDNVINKNDAIMKIMEVENIDLLSIDWDNVDEIVETECA
jgi:hypothetical protein